MFVLRLLKYIGMPLLEALVRSIGGVRDPTDYIVFTIVTFRQ